MLEPWRGNSEFSRLENAAVSMCGPNGCQTTRSTRSMAKWLHVVGLLGLGSRKEDGFQVSQGTETLAFLVQVLEAMVRRWLHLPV